MTDTVPEPVIRHHLERIQELGRRFMPMLSELARGGLPVGRIRGACRGGV
jgi:hypothetical protein